VCSWVLVSMMNASGCLSAAGRLLAAGYVAPVKYSTNEAAAVATSLLQMPQPEVAIESEKV
jgi:hypothetical protein